MSETQSTPRAWRLKETAVGRMEIAAQDEGYLLVVETTDGARWEVDASEAVTAAAEHKLQESGKQDAVEESKISTLLLERLNAAEATVEALREELQIVKSRTEELDQENALVKQYLTVAAERGFLDQLGAG